MGMGAVPWQPCGFQRSGVQYFRESVKKMFTSEKMCLQQRHMLIMPRK